MENKMVGMIEEEIQKSKSYFISEGKNDILTNCKIIGMIEMLQVVTGKLYFFDETGLHERAQ